MNWEILHILADDVIYDAQEHSLVKTSVLDQKVLPLHRVLTIASLERLDDALLQRSQRLVVPHLRMETVVAQKHAARAVAAVDVLLGIAILVDSDLDDRIVVSLKTNLVLHVHERGLNNVESTVLRHFVVVIFMVNLR